MRRPPLHTAGIDAARLLLWCVCACALLAAGCANCRIPRIDPTGERVFIWSDPAAPPGLATAPPFDPSAGPFASTAPVFGAPVFGAPVGAAPAGTAVLGAPQPVLPMANPPGLSISPAQVIAPIGSEVVMIATIIADEGYPLTREKVEWMIAPEGPGQFVSPGTRRPWDILNCLHRYPKKVTPTYAINRTLTGPMTIDRGTPTPLDDIQIRDGQAWVTVTAATEGTSHVTAFAPEVTGWDRRQQTATIYWVDAQWQFPSPGITPMGGRNTLTTTVARQSDGAPIAGWVVRYDIVGGPTALFAPSGTSSVEIITNAAGEAPAEIYQQQGFPGTNHISIQVTRPTSEGGPARPLPIGSGSTMQTWAAGDTGAPYSPPVSQPPAFTPVPATPFPSPQTPPPTFQDPSLAQPSTPQPSTPEPFTPAPTTPDPSPPPSDTPSAAAPRLELSVQAPPLAVVDSDVQFEITVVNRGNATATGLMITDTFDEGLEHSSDRASRSIKRLLSDLLPGETTRLAVTFRVTKEGELCQEISAIAMGIEPVSTRTCVTASRSPLAAEPEPSAEPQIQPDPQAEPEPSPITPTPITPPPSQPQPTPATAPLTVIKRGPLSRSVGETALFDIEITNRSDRTVTDIVIADNYEISLEPMRATGGSEWLEGNALGWRVASLEPGRTIRREIELRCLRETPSACNRVTVSARDMEPIASEACLEILAGALPAQPGAEPEPDVPAGAAKLSVSAIDTADPIRVNGQTSYQIILTNNGDGPALDVELSVQFTDELQLLQHSGPVRGSTSAGAVRFPAIRELRAGETQTFDLRFKGARAGTGTVNLRVTSRGQPQPITATQSTEVLP